MTPVEGELSMLLEKIRKSNVLMTCLLEVTSQKSNRKISITYNRAQQECAFEIIAEPSLSRI